MATAKAVLRILAVAMCFSTPAIAQDATRLTLKLNVAEVAELQRLIDQQAGASFTQGMPKAYWDLQENFNNALRDNPDALRALLARSVVR
jgi:hypothetical protein